MWWTSLGTTAVEICNLSKVCSKKKKKHDNDYKCDNKTRENQFTTGLIEDSYKRIRGNVGLNLSFNGET